MTSFVILGRGPARTQQASNFCRQDPFVARDPTHRIADATLGLADTVIRSRVDVAHSGRPGSADDGFGLLPRNRDAAAAEGRAAETQRRHLNRSSSNPSLLETGHCARSSCRSQRSCRGSIHRIRLGRRCGARQYAPKAQAVWGSTVSEFLAQLFYHAHTFSHWQARPVPEGLVEAAFELASLGPTSANCEPLRLVLVRSPEAKQRLLSCVSAGNYDKVRTAPVTAIVAYDREFFEMLPRL